MPGIEDQLREAIERDPRTRYAISKASGIGQDTLSRLMHGASVSTENAERIAAALGFQIVLRKQAKGAKHGQRDQ